jgi:hypothetical protein
MKKLIINTYIVLLILNCHTFNQTKKLSYVIKGHEKIDILRIEKVELNEKGDIQVIADIKIINNGEVLLLRCMKLNYEPNSDEYEFNYRDNKRVFWDDNCSSQFARLLEFKYIKSSDSKELLSEIRDTNSLGEIKRDILIINLGYNSLIIPLSSTLEKIIEKKPPYYRKYYYAQPQHNLKYLYSFTVSYDLLAGSLHTVAKPIQFGCIGSTLIFVEGIYKQNLFFLFSSIPFVIITCPISALLLYPDGETIWKTGKERDDKY